VSQHRKHIWTSLAVCAVLGLASSASATHDEPGRGRSVKSPLVTAYAPCTAPNTQTRGVNGVPACTPPQQVDKICGFDIPSARNGNGKVSAVSLENGDIELKVVARGLGIGCEGRRLCGTLSFRGTTDRCVDGESCTVIDLIDWVADSPAGCCVVQSGFCKLKTTVNAIRFDTVRAGDRAGVELMGCGLRRMDGANPPSADPPPGPSFRCGPLAGPLGP
jgi:hypothetical protein